MLGIVRFSSIVLGGYLGSSVRVLVLLVVVCILKFSGFSSVCISCWLVFWLFMVSRWCVGFWKLMWVVWCCCCLIVFVCKVGRNSCSLKCVFCFGWF